MKPVAVDISDTVIRLVSLERHGRSCKLHVRGEIAVPEGIMSDGDIKEPGEAEFLLKSLFSAANLHTKDIFINLPERHTFVKMISLPKGSSGDIHAAVATALSQHIPYAQEEVYWDWHPIAGTNSLGQPQALIGAAPKITVDQYLALFASAGLRVEAAEIESIAIARAVFGPEPPDDARIIIDLGRTRSTLILVDRGTVQCTKTLRYAGRELNRFIADELHISDQQAERAKTLFGLDPKLGKGVLRRVLTPHMDALVDGVADLETFFQEHYVDHRPIVNLHLTGSGAMLRNIAPELQSRLQQTVIVKPSWIFSELLKTDAELPAELGYSYSTVFGLAMRPWFS